MKSIPKIAILTHTPLWKACLQRELAPAKISQALNIEQLMHDVTEQELPTIIVELVSKSIVEDCRKVLQTSRQYPRTCFFAVGSAQLRHWLPLILSCGFADCCWKVGTLPKLVSHARFAAESGFQEQKSIEERVLKGLPWKTANQN